MNFKLQDYLSLGYLALMLIGVVRSFVYYGLLGINIMQYASISDILLSPIAFLADEPTVLFLLIGLFTLLYIRQTLKKILFEKHQQKSWYKKLFEKALIKNKLNDDKSIFDFLSFITIFCASFILGNALAQGFGDAKEIKEQTIEIKDQLTFNDNSQQKVAILGQNSAFVFYVKEGNTIVTASPIVGNIKAIEKGEE